MRSVLGAVSGFDPSKPSSIFKKIVFTPKSALDDIRSQINIDTYPDVAEGISNYLNVYQNEDSLMGEAEFVKLHRDCFATSVEGYHLAIDSLWRPIN